LRSDLLSWRGKLGILTERFRSRRKDMADESVEAFARRRLGQASTILADAFVTGIHAGDPALLSARAAFPRLASWEQEYGSVMKGMAASARQRRESARANGVAVQRGSRMWSFGDGLRRMVESLSAEMQSSLHLGVAVKKIEFAAASDGSEPRWTVHGDGRDKWPANVVVLTAPADAQARMLADLDAELATMISAIAYNRVVVVALGFREDQVPVRLDGFGFITPQQTRRDLLGVQWCSSIFPGRAPAGHVLMRALCGGWHRGEMVDWQDERLLETVRSELRLALGIVAEPVFHHIARWDRAIPQYHLGHLDRVTAIQDRAGRHPGLYLAGNAYHGIAMNDCVEQAEILATRISSSLAL
jgi:oxygen-dependent protoporphyrinogen oxidase